MASWLFLNAFFSHGGSIGHSRAAILEGIDRFGSMAAAARAVGLTYPSVWSTVRALNREFAEPLVTIERSGRSSGATLTPLGKSILLHFRELENLIKQSKQIRAFELAAGDDPKAQPPFPRWAQVVDPATIAISKKQKRSTQAVTKQKRKTVKKTPAKSFHHTRRR